MTLVELLVTLSLLSILMSLLVPSLREAKVQALRVVCLADMRVLALGVTAYAEDNADWLPPSAQRYDGKNHFELSANIVRIRSVDYDLASMLGRYIAPRALSCLEPDRKEVIDPANDAEMVHSNYIFLWGAARSTPAEGAKRLSEDHGSLAAADFTWYDVDSAEGWTPLFGGNHAKPNSPRGSAPEVDWEVNPSAAQFVQRHRPTHLLGLNAVQLSGSAAWYPRKRGTWTTAGPYNQGVAKYSAVYLPIR